MQNCKPHQQIRIYQNMNLIMAMDNFCCFLSNEAKIKPTIWWIGLEISKYECDQGDTADRPIRFSCNKDKAYFVPVLSLPPPNSSPNRWRVNSSKLFTTWVVCSPFESTNFSRTLSTGWGSSQFVTTDWSTSGEIQAHASTSAGSNYERKQWIIW
jgi:hypothetical protein